MGYLNFSRSVMHYKHNNVCPETYYLRFVIPDPDPESRFFSANSDAWIPVFTGMTF